MKRYKRNCEKCKKRYSPKDQHGNLCDKCKKKSREKARIKRNETFRKRKLNKK